MIADPDTNIPNSLPRISVLPPDVANQIAAGEVVERPSSIVKELVENALDAGARQIDILVEEGGKSRLVIRDDGHGMAAADVSLAVARHATSKIRQVDDLAGIGSLGFRGEALASIAAVAKLTITTRPARTDGGYRLIIHGGRTEWAGPVGAPPGTEIMVADIFFNTPARRKGLRGAATEFARIADIVQPAALGHPTVAFKLAHNGRVLWQTSGSGDLHTVALEVLGPTVARGLIPLRAAAAGVRLSGLIGLPAIARATRDFQFIIINGRAVRNEGLRTAVADAYRQLLPRHRYPVFILQLDLPHEEVDVNVHPAKHIVRLYREEEVAALVYDAAVAALKGADLLPRPVLGRGGRGVAGAPPRAGAAAVAGKGAAATGERAPRKERGTAPNGSGATPTTYPAGAGAGSASSVAAAGGGPRQTEAWGSQPADGHPQPPGDRRSAAARPPLAAILPQLRVLGVVDQTYIVAAGPDGLYLIDQHAAHERIYFEHFMGQGPTRYALTQQLGVPLPVDLSPREMALWEEHRLLVEAFGFRVESFGPGTILLREVPWLYRREGAGHHLQELLAALARGIKDGQPVRLEDDVALRAMAACKSAVKAHDPLTPSEITALLAALAVVDNPYTCPHGRPTTVTLTIGQLERLFKRS